jgi:purine-binding chemotaxis protein CheW
MVAKLHRFVVFSLEERRCALPVDAVREVLPAVEITPLPQAPPVCLGIVDVRGTVLPVVDPRQRFGLPPRELELSDRLVVARSASREVVLRVDAVEGVVAAEDASVIDPAAVVPGLELVRGIVRVAGALVLIHNLDAFLSLEESTALDRALQRLEEEV